MKKEALNKACSEIAKNVKRLKKKNHLSKSDLVRETGLDYHTIAKIESGRTPDPRISTIKKIADAFKEPLEELIK
ncbi:MAG: helix-turn-helix transcriptional regulator [Candidatus Moraniibacteriota bacterium]